MQIDIERILNHMQKQIGELAKENAILKAQIEQLQEEKKEG